MEMELKSLRGIMIILILLLAIISFSYNDYSPDYSIYNEGDKGTSKLRESLEQMNYTISRILISPIILRVSNFSMMVIVGSERSYSQAEISAYKSFVEDGGTLVLFEDFGPAKSIAQAFGITFVPGMLKETQKELYVNRPSQFFVQDLIFSQLALGIQLPPLLVSEAVALIDFEGFSFGQTLPILATYDTAFIDTNDNDVVDAVDLHAGQTPLGLYKQYENGTIIVIGDASLPLNVYWDRNGEITGQQFPLMNGLWTSFLISTFAQIAGASEIIFDESHQAAMVTSASGLFNFITGTWVGLINTLIVNIFIGVVVVAFSSIRVRKRLRKEVAKRWRRENIQTNGKQDLINYPSTTERSLSEQYILYQTMGDGFIQLANSDLVRKIKNANKGEDFIKSLERKYGNLYEPRRIEELMEIHLALRDFVQKNMGKWL